MMMMMVMMIRTHDGKLVAEGCRSRRGGRSWWTAGAGVESGRADQVTVSLAVLTPMFAGSGVLTAPLGQGWISYVHQGILVFSWEKYMCLDEEGPIWRVFAK